MDLHKRCCILVSRQALRPCGSMPWVQGVLKAVELLATRPCLLVSSIGSMTWDVITVAASRAGLPTHLVVIPETSTKLPTAASLCEQYGLDPSGTSFEFLGLDGKMDRTEWMKERDRRIVSSCDYLVPVAVRTGGTMTGVPAIPLFENN